MNVAHGPDKIGECHKTNSEETLLAFQHIINERIERTRPGKKTVLVPFHLFNKYMINDGATDAIVAFYESAGWHEVYWDHGFILRASEYSL